MLCWDFTGMADEEELLAHIARLQNQDESLHGRGHGLSFRA